MDTNETNNIDKTKMREIKIEKVTVNIGAGENGDKLQKAKKVLEKICGRTVVLTKARKREQTFGIKKGETIGAKVTLRGKDAEEFLRKAFDAVEFKLNKNSFDRFGNFSFGIKEYIDFPGVKYDPMIGLMGCDVCVTLTRPGKRVKIRKRKRSRIPLRHHISKDEAIEFIQKKFNVNIIQ